MAVSGSLLTADFDDTDTTSWATASISPGANKLILAAVVTTRTGASTTVVSASGCGLTWVAVGTPLQFDTESTPRSRLSLFRAMGASPSAGAVTFSTGANSHTGARWIVSEYDGVDTSGADGSGAIVQSVTNPGRAGTPSVTLAAFGDVGNGAYAAFSQDPNELVNEFEAGWTQLAEVVSAAPAMYLVAGWRADNDTVPRLTDVVNASTDWGAVGAELKAAAAGPGVSLATPWIE